MENKKAEEIIKEYDRYIRTVANNFNQSLYTEDLIQIGRIEAIDAHQRLIEGKDSKSYITTCIKGAMKKYLTQNARTIRIPSNQVFKIDSIPVYSLDIETNENGELLCNNIPSEVSEVQSENKGLRNALNALKPKWKLIVEMYFDLQDTNQPKTFKEIGEELGISRQAVCLQYKKAMKIIQSELQKEKDSI